MREFLVKIMVEIYVYCTNFIINLANLTGTSYYEVNAFIFCFLWVIITFILITFLVIQLIRLKKVRKIFYIKRHRRPESPAWGYNKV